MTIGGQDLLTILVASLISFLAACVKTVLSYTRDGIFPKKLDFVVNIILSFFIGVLTSFACAHFKVDEDLTYIIVALSALSAERLLSAIPTIFVKKLENTFGVKPTREEYKEDPINKTKEN